MPGIGPVAKLVSEVGSLGCLGGLGCIGDGLGASAVVRAAPLGGSTVDSGRVVQVAPSGGSRNSWTFGSSSHYSPVIGNPSWFEASGFVRTLKLFA